MLKSWVVVLKADIQQQEFYLSVDLFFFVFGIRIGSKLYSPDGIHLDTEICWSFLGSNPALNILALISMTFLGIISSRPSPRNLAALLSCMPTSHNFDLRLYCTICK